MRGWFLLLVLVVIAAVGVLVPYLVLGDTPGFAASYLFWCVITLVVIVIFGFVYTARWGRGATDDAAAGGDRGAAPDRPGPGADRADPGRGATDDAAAGGDRGAAPDRPGPGADRDPRRGSTGRDTGGRA